MTPPTHGTWGCSRSMLLESAADGVFESHFKSHTEPVLRPDKEELQNS